MRPIRILAAAVPALALVAACSSTLTVPRADIEEEVRNGIAAEIDLAPGEVVVSCPGELVAEVGTTMTCSVTAGEAAGEVLVTITSVDGADVGFDWSVSS